MWPVRSRSNTVTCLACDVAVDRNDAREYDKYGDRWNRTGKRFEYFCKSCYDDLCHHARDELEALLIELEAGERDQLEFLSAYVRTVDERYGPIDEQ